jgi:hypothetical protein
MGSWGWKRLSNFPKKTFWTWAGDDHLNHGYLGRKPYAFLISHPLRQVWSFLQLFTEHQLGHWGRAKLAEILSLRRLASAGELCTGGKRLCDALITRVHVAWSTEPENTPESLIFAYSKSPTQKGDSGYRNISPTIPFPLPQLPSHITVIPKPLTPSHSLKSLLHS